MGALERLVENTMRERGCSYEVAVARVKKELGIVQIMKDQRCSEKEATKIFNAQNKVTDVSDE